MRSGRLADLECNRLLRTRNFDREWAWPSQKCVWLQNFHMNPPSQNPRSATVMHWSMRCIQLDMGDNLLNFLIKDASGGPETVDYLE